ncbi:MAG: S8 family serine peptidase [Aliishimia sp.]
MDDHAPIGPHWSRLGAIADTDPQSPYLHWAKSPPGGPIDNSTPDATHADLLNVRSNWLAKALDKTMGAAPSAWPPLLRQILPTSCFGPAADKPSGKRNRSLPHAQDKVIMALIDDGIAFAQERFRLPGLQTRVDYLWLQGAAHSGTASDIPFGREFSQDDLNSLLRKHRTGPNGDMIDEEGLYRDAGALNMSQGSFQSLARRAGHGTAVLDLASGFALDTDRRDRTFQSLPDRMGIDPRTYDLALVSLPQTVTADTSGTYAEIFIILALARLLDHVEQRCLKDGKDYPVIVNLSFGLSAGPKDGSSLLDRFIDAIPKFRGPDRAPVRMVMPAGNHRLARSCARLEAPLDASAPPLFWSLSPDDKTPSFLEIWSSRMNKRPENLNMSIALISPMSDTGATLYGAEMDSVHSLGDETNMQARAYVQWVPQEEVGRVRITLAVPPTIPTSPGAPYVTAGDWRLLIAPEGATPLGWPLDLMIQRDDMIPGFRNGGRQSRFFDPRYSEQHATGRVMTSDPVSASPAHIRREGTLNALATANDTIVVAGCYADTLKPVSYSGTGSRAMGVRMPDVSAPASVSRLRGGISAAGTRSGSRIGVEGTSVAAPTMARELAKASRPITERPKLSGVPMLRTSMSEDAAPTVLPVGEDMLDSGEKWAASGYPFSAI